MANSASEAWSSKLLKSLRANGAIHSTGSDSPAIGQRGWGVRLHGARLNRDL